MDVTVLFADICDSVRLFDTRGNEQAHQLVLASLNKMTSIVSKFEGEVWRTLGDGILCTFPNPDCAFSAALEIQDHHRIGPISIKVGFSHGSLIEDGGELFGDAANLAARILALARPGEVLLSEDAIRRLSGANRDAVEMLISTLVKGKRKPIKVFRVVEKTDLQATQQISLEISHAAATKVRTLVVTAPNGVETRFMPHSDPALIGRAPGCDLFANSPLASRFHATIEPRGEKYLLSDTSTNGTFIQFDGEELSVLKRDGMRLRGQGVIGIGEKPGVHPNCDIAFRIERIPRQTVSK
jgi:adenylate cyclase